MSKGRFTTGLAGLKTAQKKHMKEQGGFAKSVFLRTYEFIKDYVEIPFCVLASSEKDRPRGIYPYCMHRLPHTIDADTTVFRDVLCLRGRKEHGGVCAICDFNEYQVMEEASPYNEMQADSNGDAFDSQFDAVQRCLLSTLYMYNFNPKVNALVLADVRSAKNEDNKNVVEVVPCSDPNKFTSVMFDLRPWNNYNNKIDNRDVDFIRFLYHTYATSKGSCFNIVADENLDYATTQWFHFQELGKKKVLTPVEGCEDWEVTSAMLEAAKTASDPGTWRSQPKENKPSALFKYDEQIKVLTSCQYAKLLGGWPKITAQVVADPIRCALDDLEAINRTSK